MKNKEIIIVYLVLLVMLSLSYITVSIVKYQNDKIKELETKVEILEERYWDLYYINTSEYKGEYYE